MGDRRPRRDGRRPLPHRPARRARAQRAAGRRRAASATARSSAAIRRTSSSGARRPGSRSATGTIIREYSTINRGTSATYRTVVGARCFIMTYVHLAHDCHVGDDVIIANGTQCAGHVTIHDRAVLSGLNADPPVRDHRDLRVRRRRLAGEPGHPAVREGGGQPDGAVRPQLDRAPARRLLGRDDRRR